MLRNNKRLGRRCMQSHMEMGECVNVKNKPIGERIWDKTNLLLPIEIFDEMKRLNVSFVELDNIINSYIEWRNKAFGVNIGHSRVKLTMLNMEFAFSVSGDFIIWNSNGFTALGRYDIDCNAPPTREFIEWIYCILDNYSHNILHCSDCGKPLPDGKYAGRYFAGVYCEDCWEEKWRAIEAAEDYE